MVTGGDLLDSADVHGTDIAADHVANEKTKLVTGVTAGINADGKELRAKPMSVNTDGIGKDQGSLEDEIDYEKPYTCKTFWWNAMIVLPFAGQLILSMIFYMLVQLMNTYFVGHTNDPVMIAGIGMGNMLINVFAFAVMQGLNGALESLVSISFGAS